MRYCLTAMLVLLCGLSLPARAAAVGPWRPGRTGFTASVDGIAHDYTVALATAMPGRTIKVAVTRSGGTSAFTLHADARGFRARRGIPRVASTDGGR